MVRATDQDTARGRYRWPGGADRVSGPVHRVRAAGSARTASPKPRSSISLPPKAKLRGASLARCGSAQVEHVGEEYVPDGLELPAHDAERHHRHAVLALSPGMIVWSGRLRGASSLGCPATSEKALPRFFQQHA